MRRTFARALFEEVFASKEASPAEEDREPSSEPTGRPGGPRDDQSGLPPVESGRRGQRIAAALSWATGQTTDQGEAIDAYLVRAFPQGRSGQRFNQILATMGPEDPYKRAVIGLLRGKTPDQVWAAIEPCDAEIRGPYGASIALGLADIQRLARLMDQLNVATPRARARSRR
jgi:hypothetical protein